MLSWIVILFCISVMLRVSMSTNTEWPAGAVTNDANLIEFDYTGYNGTFLLDQMIGPVSSATYRFLLLGN